MKVKELLAELAKYDLEMPVFFYDTCEEADANIKYVQEVGTPLYCKGDSWVEEYFRDHPDKRTVVMLHNSKHINENKDLYAKSEIEEEDCDETNQIFTHSSRND